MPFMRIFLIILCWSVATPSLAWQFTPGIPCTLSHETADVAVELTFDPNAPLYTITLTRPTPWPDAPLFSMRYQGPFGREISTDRHQLSNGGRSLTVADRGFGNVLSGLLQDNAFVAMSGTASVTVPLAGAAQPTAAFAACRPAAGV